MQRVYHNEQEYAQSLIAKTGVEPRMQGTKANKRKKKQRIEIPPSIGYISELIYCNVSKKIYQMLKCSSLTITFFAQFSTF